MNKSDQALIALAARAVEDLGVDLRVEKTTKTAQEDEGDALWQLRSGRVRLPYVVQARRGLTQNTLGATLAQLQHVTKATGRPSLLVTDHVPFPLAQKLRDQRQQFVDVAGNAYLQTPGLLIFVAAHRSKLQAESRPARSLTVAGLKTLFALICDPSLAEAPQRAIAAAAGVALGAVPGVLRDLQEAGYLFSTGRRRRLEGSKRLLDQWAMDYARKLRRKTLIARYATTRFEDWSKWPLHPPAELWGGEPAANILVQYLRPAVLTLYTHKLPPALQVECRLVPARPHTDGHVLEVREPFWGQLPPASTRKDVVPPALVYADLLATGDSRCIETAQLVYDQHLARLLPDR